MSDTTVNRLPAGAVIGILGTGQLGRMLALAAARLGFKSHVFGPELDAPAHAVSAAHTISDYEDADALQRFAASVDVVTYEFENVPRETAEILSGQAAIFPSPEALRVAQDRLIEKTFLGDIGIPVADFSAIGNADDLNRAIQAGKAPGILKTRRFGYDGKGQIRISSESNPSACFAEIGGQPAILEAVVPFAREISVIATRGKDGSFQPFDIAENIHREGILHTSTVPSLIDRKTQEAAIGMAQSLMQALDYVGVLGLELFHCPRSDGPVLLANEFAPRVHNSGHWTMDGCVTDQFEQHIRAVAGWPLGDTTRHSDVVMTNLIGDEIDQVSARAMDSGTALHIYGKSETRPGRKMGHFNTLSPRRDLQK